MTNTEWHTNAKSRWDTNAENWHSKSEDMWLAGSRKAIIPFFKKTIDEGANVGDLGCGDGYGSYLLHENGYKVTGMDFSHKMVEIANGLERDQLKFVQGDLTRMPFLDGEFDAVMAINSIEWTESPVDALHEIERVTVKGGLICIGLLGPTAHPRDNSYPRLHGEEAICNTMMPWELEKVAEEKGWNKVDEEWVYKKGVDERMTGSLPNELRQALTFMTLFMFRT
ncbi:class I SAM-dependent methyltransferase [Rossellomorea aquimaris]|uniref:class I SAM-dependent methyltransferase n=1 Tax=Rossellomorea aquimaris TaxID=189382 RepID=UPI001CD65017|nr:class I SAM-dependent methyltransferase [Rossellomorea aquimaris]MCA1054561.1 class I SAM-dependent methyltransferase [Rossellomorea aquimaris]